jgi:hypothetical protein
VGAEIAPRQELAGLPHVILHFVEGRQEQDGSLAGFGRRAKAPAHLEAREVWHHDIQEDEVGVLAGRGLQAVRAGSGCQYLISCDPDGCSRLLAKQRRFFGLISRQGGLMPLAFDCTNLQIVEQVPLSKEISNTRIYINQ